MKTITITDSAEMEQIISECQICFVGFAAPDGTPYVLPMNFAYHEGQIILHSAPFGTHQEMLKVNNRVCITFCTRSFSFVFIILISLFTILISP